MPSIAFAEAHLRAADRPVLFLDTCVLIDVIRATLRCLGTSYVQRAIELRGLLAAAPPSCAKDCVIVEECLELTRQYLDLTSFQDRLGRDRRWRECG
jgi:hypothetical protein